MKHSSLCASLNRGDILLGFALNYPAPGIIELVAKDWDWLWIDNQHGQFSYDNLIHCIQTAAVLEIPAIVRVPGQERSWILKTLDMAPAGIMVPQVNTVDEAKAVVNAAKFPPLGQHSFGKVPQLRLNNCGNF